MTAVDGSQEECRSTATTLVTFGLFPLAARVREVLETLLKVINERYARIWPAPLNRVELEANTMGDSAEQGPAPLLPRPLVWNLP